jgi:hypothetical protein
MKHLTITLSLLAIFTACKKEKHEGQKCVWNVIINNQVAYEWLEKPSADQIKIIEASCSCTIKVNEVCFSCNATVTTASGVNVECK